MITKEELNKAIYEVINHNTKYGVEDAHKIVKNAGYKVYKQYGRWTVKSTNTYKTVTCRDFGYDNERVDYVNYLNTPRNNYAVYKSPETNYQHMKHELDYLKKETLNTPAWNVKFAMQEIEHIERDLERAKKYLQTALDEQAASMDTYIKRRNKIIARYKKGA